MAKLVRLRKHVEPHTDTEGSWAISYGDMITLLLSFFVIFFSFDFKKENDTKLEESAIKNIALLGSTEDKNNGLIDSESTQLDELNEVTTIVQKAKSGQLVVFFKGANFFDSGKESVNDLGKILLDKFIKKYIPYAGKFKLKIQAFTDDKPVRANIYRYRDNVELSALRSISILRHLSQNGVPLNRVEIGGQGILSAKGLEVLGIKNDNIEQIRKMSRTIAFILYREDAS